MKIERERERRHFDSHQQHTLKLSYAAALIYILHIAHRTEPEKKRALVYLHYEQFPFFSFSHCSVLTEKSGTLLISLEMGKAEDNKKSFQIRTLSNQRNPRILVSVECFMHSGSDTIE